MDNPNLEDYNVDQKVNDFIQYTMNQYEKYNTNSLIMTMGSDFQYSNAHMWYKNLDKLIHYVNQRQITNGSKINIFYSTPACYLYSLNQANKTWTVKYDDFFPYAHRPHSFWTGYFTSRAALKYYARRASNYLKAFRILGVFLKLKENPFDLLEKAIGVVQHHDGVSGTERQHVTYDYAKRLSIGVDSALSNIFSDVSNQIFPCLLNISDCSLIEKESNFGIYILNSLNYDLDVWIRVPVEYDDYDVFDDNGEQLDTELSVIDEETKKIPERKSNAIYNVVFKISLPPFLTQLVYFRRNLGKSFFLNTRETKNELQPFDFENEYIKYSFDKSGNLNQIVNIESGISTPLKQFFCFYQSMPGNNSEYEFQASGAYIFRPIKDSCVYLSVRNYTVYQGKMFSEVHQVYNDWISQTIRLYENTRHAEFEWQVGPINIDDEIGKEVVVKFMTDLKSQSTFYTDANGREMLKRVRDYRPTWKLNQTEKTSGNYYPVNSRIFIRDEQANKQFTIVTDRSQGGSSIEDGSVEIMLHRRVLHDDSLGVSEPLNETGSDGNGLVVKGKLYAIFDRIENSAKLHRPLALQINSEPLYLFFKNNQYEHKNASIFPMLKDYKFPPNLNLLTFIKEFESETVSSIIIRIEHFYEIGEDATLSKPVKFDLKKFFLNFGFSILSVDELALGANMKVEELTERLQWKAQQSRLTKRDYGDFLKNFYKKQKTSVKSDDFIYDFQPMQIRTFHVRIPFQ
jgi:lysosomal alpha-mannosidase